MRTARKKVKGRSCYYHACARIAGAKDDYLFTDVDKEKGMKIVQDLSRLFFVEPISMSWMGNHWHLIVFVDDKPPSLEEAAERYNLYYGKKRMPLDPKLDREKCGKIAEQLCDISFFMRQIHQQFTFYINRVHNRRGALWADRFKSTILDGEQALWNCVKYIELNAVRAKLVEDPADYRFCSWGNFCDSGRHVFGDNFVQHMRLSLGEVAKDLSDEEIYAEFRGELARTASYESGITEKPARNQGRCEEERKHASPVFVSYPTLDRRINYWSKGFYSGGRMSISGARPGFEEAI